MVYEPWEAILVYMPRYYPLVYMPRYYPPWYTSTLYHPGYTSILPYMSMLHRCHRVRVGAREGGPGLREGRIPWVVTPSENKVDKCVTDVVQSVRRSFRLNEEKMG